MKSPLFPYVNMPLKQHILKDLRGFSEIHGETRNLKQTEDGVFAHVLTASRSTFKVIQQARQRLGTPWNALERLGDLHMENHGWSKKHGGLIWIMELMTRYTSDFLGQWA